MRETNDAYESAAETVVVVWWHGVRYEDTWRVLYPIIRRDVDICEHCKCEYLGLERVGRKLLCGECRRA